MLYVEDKVMKLNGKYIGGEVTSVEIQEAGNINVEQDDNGKIKSTQPVGYETAKVMVNVLLEKTKDSNTIDQIMELQSIFKSPGQGKPRLLHVINEDCAARGITKVYFKSLTTKKIISESKRIASIELWAPSIAGIVVKKKKTKSKETKKSNKKTYKSKKQKDKSPAKDTRITDNGKKKAKKV